MNGTSSVKAKIGFLGCGLIGRSMMQWLERRPDYAVSFIQDRAFEGDGVSFPVLREQNAELLRRTSLVVECATADVLKANAKGILKNCDLMPFSLTAFSDPEFAAEAEALCRENGTRMFFPHGAILGLDGIFDGRNIWENVSVESVKNPKSLGRSDTDRTVVYEGRTRDVCREYPRNVNIHAAVALAGIGFDKTVSKIVSDPAADTHTHTIRVQSGAIEASVRISSPASGVTSLYTLHSACGSLARALNTGKERYIFV